jgi:hypothetical protein
MEVRFSRLTTARKSARKFSGRTTINKKGAELLTFSAVRIIYGTDVLLYYDFYILFHRSHAGFVFVEFLYADFKI